MTSPPSKYCLNCSYVLDGLPERRYPECGRSFDPDDPRTFNADRLRKRRRWNVLLRPSTLGLWLSILIPLLMGLLAWLLLSLLTRLERPV